MIIRIVCLISCVVSGLATDAATYEDCMTEYGYAYSKLANLHHNDTVKSKHRFLIYSYTMKARFAQIKTRWEHIICDPRYVAIRDTITNVVYDIFKNFNDQVDAYYAKSAAQPYEPEYRAERAEEVAHNQSQSDTVQVVIQEVEPMQTEFQVLRRRLEQIDQECPSKLHVQSVCKVQLFKWPEREKAKVEFVRLPKYENIYELLELFTKQPVTNIAAIRLLNALTKCMNYEYGLRENASSLLNAFDNMPISIESECKSIEGLQDGSYEVFKYMMLVMHARLDDMKKLTSEVKPKWVLTYELQYNLLGKVLEKLVCKDMVASALLPFLYKFVEEYYANVFAHECSKVIYGKPHEFKFTTKLYEEMFDIVNKRGSLWLNKNSEQVASELRNLHLFGPSCCFCC